MSRAGDAAIRISYVERDEAVSTLGAHLSTGRLELDEYEERCGKAVAARTRGDIEELFTDLPAPHPDLSSATPPAQLTRKAGQPVRNPRAGKTRASDAFGAAAGLTFFLGVPWAIVNFHGGWGLFIPLGIVLIVTIALAKGATRPAIERPRSDT
jgi:hypothetical protein